MFTTAPTLVHFHHLMLLCTVALTAPLFTFISFLFCRFLACIVDRAGSSSMTTSAPPGDCSARTLPTLRRYATPHGINAI